jgi:Lsr2
MQTRLWQLSASGCGCTPTRLGLSTLVDQISESYGVTVAQKIQTLLIDDLDGSEAEGTVRFGLDGTEYEIDLSAEHAQALRDALARYVSAARQTAGGVRRPARGGRRAPASGLDTTEVREWAKEQGIEVKDRGRVPAEVVARFKAATGK